MDVTTMFWKGLLVGVIIAAPVGPVAVMCIHRAIAQGKLAGYVSGFGAACADAIYGAIAAFSVGFLMGPLLNHNAWVRFAGGTLLCLIGLRAMLTRRTPPPATRDREKLFSDFASAFVVTLTNPTTVISFAAIFAAINIPHIADHPRLGAVLTFGVLLGATLWWFLLTTVAALFHGRVTERGMLWITRVSGVVIFAFGALLLLSLLGVVDLGLDDVERRIQERTSGSIGGPVL
ncbi:MAG TPA: LysE family transporter [Alphaproteobacteria bacterium]|jgi:threonine/homoserine/homoserine lactone efflux protein